MRDERSPYHYLPGGRVKRPETTEDAIHRELNFDVHNIKPILMCQNYFTEDVHHEKYHEICIYYSSTIYQSYNIQYSSKNGNDC